MNAALQALLTRPRVIGDGAYGTALREVQDGSPPELLNLSDPGRVRDLARAYLNAGAEALYANTFGSSFPPLNGDVHCHGLVREGVALAVDAAAGRVPVLAAFGPAERSIVNFDNHYMPLAAVAIAAGASGIVLETMTSVEAAARACVGLGSAGFDVLVSFTLRRVEGELRTHDGKDLVLAANRALDAGACAVGFNCCDGPAVVLDAVTRLRDVVDVPIFARPNAGVSHTMPPDEFGQWAAQLYEAGAWMVGGCCGTTPAHVAAIARARPGD